MFPFTTIHAVHQLKPKEHKKEAKDLPVVAYLRISILVLSSLQFTRKRFVSLLSTLTCFSFYLQSIKNKIKNLSNCTYTAGRQKRVMLLKVNHWLRVGLMCKVQWGRKHQEKQHDITKNTLDLKD